MKKRLLCNLTIALLLFLFLTPIAFAQQAKTDDAFTAEVNLINAEMKALRQEFRYMLERAKTLNAELNQYQVQLNIIATERKTIRQAAKMDEREKLDKGKKKKKKKKKR